jgi:hypothetical protein
MNNKNKIIGYVWTIAGGGDDSDGMQDGTGNEAVFGVIRGITVDAGMLL